MRVHRSAQRDRGEIAPVRPQHDPMVARDLSDKTADTTGLQCGRPIENKRRIAGLSLGVTRGSSSGHHARDTRGPAPRGFGLDCGHG